MILSSALLICIVWLVCMMSDDFDLFMALHDYKFFVKRVACKFSAITYKFVNAPSMAAAMRVLNQHEKWVVWFVQYVCDDCAPELVSEAEVFPLILMMQHHSFQPESDNVKRLRNLTAGCYRNFMGIVMQLRMLGEVRGSACVDDFRRGMAEFLKAVDVASAAEPSI